MSEALSNVDDKELYELIEKANLADKLVNDPTYKLLREAADRIVERAVTEFALKAEPDNLVEIIKLQTVIRLYKFGLFREVEVLKRESESAYQEAKDRGVFGNFLESIKEKVGL